MRTSLPVTWSACLLLSVAFRSISGHVMIADENRDGDGVDRKQQHVAAAESRVLDMESIFSGFAKSMISRTGGTSSQVLKQKKKHWVFSELCIRIIPKKKKNSKLNIVERLSRTYYVSTIFHQHNS